MKLSKPSNAANNFGRVGASRNVPGSKSAKRQDVREPARGSNTATPPALSNINGKTMRRFKIEFKYGCWVAEDEFGNSVLALTKSQLRKAFR